MKAVILAGGKGVRLRPLTDNMPKAMVKVGSKPILQRILESLMMAGIKEALIVVGYKKEVIENFFGENFKGLKLTYFVQKEQLGTAHALSLVEGFVQGTFLVLNADVLVEPGVISELCTQDEFDKSDAVIIARAVNDPWRYGCLLVTPQGNLKDIIEKPAPGQEPGNLVNAGIYRFGQGIFDAIKKTDLSVRNEFELVDSIKILVKSGKTVSCRDYGELTIDIGDYADLKRAQQIFLD